MKKHLLSRRDFVKMSGLIALEAPFIKQSNANTKSSYTIAEDETKSAVTGLEPFIGTWGERWADVSKNMNIRIEKVNGVPKVTMNGWRVWDENFKDGKLSFRKKGGDSHWEFVYTITAKPGEMELEVFRVHDKKRFVGNLIAQIK